jgi:hypothetical protein
MLVDVTGFEPATPCLQTGGTAWQENSKSLFGLRLAHESTRTNSFNCSQVAPRIRSKMEAAHVIHAVIGSLEITLLNNLGTDGFTLKFGSFGRFSVRHKPGIRRKIGFSGETIQTKARGKVTFVSLGVLRQQERVD